MQRKASAAWQGGIKDGKGQISTDSGVLSSTPYSFEKRFGEEKGTNPEELIAAAHASCFSMALSLGLGNAGLTADSIDTKAVVTLDKDGDGFSITAVHLTCKAKVAGTDAATFAKIAQATKEACPVSKVLKATITLDAALDS